MTTKEWVVARLKEPSTWRGIVWLATTLGVSLKPEVWEQVVAVGMAVAGLIGILSSEPPKTLPPIEPVGRSEPESVGMRDMPPGSRAEPERSERFRDGWNG